MDSKPHLTFRKNRAFRDMLTLPNSEMFQPKHFINCNTTGLVYLLRCDCGSHYVGKTKRKFWKRISDYVSDITTGILDKSPVARHFSEKHKYKTDSLKFTALARIHPPLRGGDFDQLVLQTESKWIYRLRANVHPGLNDLIRFASFLELD